MPRGCSSRMRAHSFPYAGRGVIRPFPSGIQTLRTPRESYNRKGGGSLWASCEKKWRLRMSQLGYWSLWTSRASRAIRIPLSAANAPSSGLFRRSFAPTPLVSSSSSFTSKSPMKTVLSLSNSWYFSVFFLYLILLFIEFLSKFDRLGNAYEIYLT